MNIPQTDSPIIISTSAYEPLRLALESELSADGSRAFDSVPLERRTFADGETYLRFGQPVNGRHVILVGSTQDERDLVELLSLGWQAVRDGAHTISFAIPYFGYSTMERAVKNGEVVRAKANAVLFSVVPTPPGGKHIYLIDLHSEGIPHYFEGCANVVHLYAQEILLNQVRALTQGAGEAPLVVASADTGRAKWVESYARALGVPAAFITKRRHGDKSTEVMAVGGAEVGGCCVVLYDDMIRSGTSIINAVRAYRDAGAVRVIIATTHLVLQAQGAAGVLQRLLASGITDLVTTDSLAHVHQEIAALTPNERARVHIASIAPLLARAIENRGMVE